MKTFFKRVCLNINIIFASYRKTLIFLLLVLCPFFFFMLQFKNKPLVSVVMPTYNRSDLLPRSIESILTQSFKDFEFIIIDDGSTDETAKIIKEYAAQDKRIRFVRNETNKGISFSRTRGNDLARGKYIAIMDSDDQSLPNRLEKSVAFMEEHPDVDAMSGQLLSADENINPQILLSGKKYNIIKNPFQISLMFSNTFCNVSSIFRREFIQKHKIKYDTKYISAEDYDFWKQFIMFKGRIITIQEPLVLARKHSSNADVYYSEMIENSKKIHSDLIRRFFKPSENEIKWSYTLKEKCMILKKAVFHNNEKKVMSQIEIEEYYKSTCPPDLDKSIFLKHPYWEDFLYPINDNGQYTRWIVNVPARIQRQNDKLIVIWDGYPKETFILGNLNEYIYFSNDGIRLKHPNWIDYISFLPNNEFCRISVPDCGKALKRSSQEITIQWKNTNYPIERYVLNHKTGLYHLKK